MFKIGHHWLCEQESRCGGLLELFDLCLLPTPTPIIFCVWCDCIYLWNTVTKIYLSIFLSSHANQFIGIVILLHFLPCFCFVFASIHSDRNAELKSKAPIFIVDKSNTNNKNNYLCRVYVLGVAYFVG